MVKIWNEAMWKPEENSVDLVVKKIQPAAWTGTIIVVALTLLLGLTIGYTYDYLADAARQLLDPSLYIKAVLPEQP